MTILLVIIVFYILVMLIGKLVDKISYMGYLFIGILTALEVGVIMYLLFIMETPDISGLN